MSSKEVSRLLRFLKRHNEDDSSEDEYDVNLCREIKAYVWLVPIDSDGYKLIEKYIQNTSDPEKRIIIKDVFRVNRLGEKRRYRPHKDSDNRMLLWHGSRTQNIKSILSDGLEIRPDSKGNMFGAGIYFADAARKSAKYSLPSSDSKGFLLLAEVALGKSFKTTQADHSLTQPPKGYQSVEGIGKYKPNPDKNYVRTDGVTIPLGKLIPRSRKTYTLNYNEYVVYDESRINIQYVVCFKSLDK